MLQNQISLWGWVGLFFSLHSALDMFGILQDIAAQSLEVILCSYVFLVLPR